MWANLIVENQHRTHPPSLEFDTLCLSDTDKVRKLLRPILIPGNLAASGFHRKTQEK